MRHPTVRADPHSHGDEGLLLRPEQRPHEAQGQGVLGVLRRGLGVRRGEQSSLRRGLPVREALDTFQPRVALRAGARPLLGGHYKDSEALVPWAALPEDDDPPNTGGASSSHEIAPWQVADPSVLTSHTGWWPVVSITTTTLTRCGGTVVVVVCVYQWMWDRPTGWRIRVVEMRSRL